MRHLVAVQGSLVTSMLIEISSHFPIFSLALVHSKAFPEVVSVYEHMGRILLCPTIDPEAHGLS